MYKVTPVAPILSFGYTRHIRNRFLLSYTTTQVICFKHFEEATELQLLNT